MKEAEIWNLIEQSRPTGNTALDGHVDILAKKISAFSETDYLDFAYIWENIEKRAFLISTWAAFNIYMAGCCTEEEFDDCISSLMFCGQEKFLSVLENPDSLVDILDFESSERAHFFIRKGWDKRHRGKQLPFQIPVNWHIWPKSDEDQKEFYRTLPNKYPRLCAKFGVPQFPSSNADNTSVV